MRKSLLVMVIILAVSLAILAFFSVADKVSYEQKVIHAFNQSKAEAMISNISFNGLLSNSRMSVEELKRVANVSLNKLDINMLSIEEEENSSDTYSEYRVLARTLEDDILKIEAWSRGSDEEEKAASCIKLDFYQDHFYDDFEKVREKVQKVLIPYVAALEVTSSITGTYNGKLDEDSIKTINSRVFKNMGKRGMAYKTQDDSTSVFFSSPLNVQTFISSYKGGNLQLSVRYNKAEDKTYITLSALRKVE